MHQTLRKTCAFLLCTMLCGQNTFAGALPVLAMDEPIQTQTDSDSDSDSFTSLDENSILTPQSLQNETPAIETLTDSLPAGASSYASDDSLIPLGDDFMMSNWNLDFGQFASDKANGIYSISYNAIKFLDLETMETQTIWKLEKSAETIYEQDNIVTLMSSYTMNDQILAFVEVYDLDNQVKLNSVTLRMDGDGFDYPSAIARHSDGRLLTARKMTDSGNLRLEMWDAEGRRLSSSEPCQNEFQSFTGWNESNDTVYGDYVDSYEQYGYTWPRHAAGVVELDGNNVKFCGHVNHEGLGMLIVDGYCISRRFPMKLIDSRWLLVQDSTNGYVSYVDTNTWNTQTQQFGESCAFYTSAGLNVNSYDSYECATIRARSAGDGCIWTATDLNVLAYIDLENLSEIGWYATPMIIQQTVSCNGKLYILGWSRASGTKQFYMDIVEPYQEAPFYLSIDDDVLESGESSEITITCTTDWRVPVAFSSADPSIVTVDFAGNLSAGKPGTTTITVTSSTGQKQEIDINVWKNDNRSLLSKVTGDTTEYSSNASANSYGTWDTVTRSYLFENSDGTLTRVEDKQNGRVVVERYNRSGGRTSAFYVAHALPIFGAVFADEDYNYLVSGQSNPNDSDSVEVLCIERFDKNWTKLNEKRILGENTYEPFDAGSCMLDSLGDSLYLYTCHEMYDFNNSGVHHQANMIFKLNKVTLEVEDKQTDIANLSYGYVSHSFNQLIKADEKGIYRADHGDANPRAFALIRSNPQGSINSVTYTTPITFSNFGSNYNITYANLGGLDVSDTAVLAVGHCVEKEGAYASNIVLMTADLTVQSSYVTWITDYTSTSTTAIGNPQLVKVADQLFVLLWEEKTGSNISVRMCIIDDSGRILSDIKTLDARLSDCQPVLLSTGEVAWYYTTGGKPEICRLSWRQVWDNAAAQTPDNPEPGAPLDYTLIDASLSLSDFCTDQLANYKAKTSAGFAQCKAETLSAKETALSQKLLNQSARSLNTAMLALRLDPAICPEKMNQLK